MLDEVGLGAGISSRKSVCVVNFFTTYSAHRIMIYPERSVMEKTRHCCVKLAELARLCVNSYKTREMTKARSGLKETEMKYIRLWMLMWL